MTEPIVLTIFGILATICIALQSWILLKLIDLDRQVYRLVSDRESEKGTMARIHSDFERRLRLLERRPA